MTGEREGWGFYSGQGRHRKEEAAERRPSALPEPPGPPEPLTVQQRQALVADAILLERAAAALKRRHPAARERPALERYAREWRTRAGG